ncbi:hypothetical protein HY374_00985 [Candidatus Berkelbacteria bacterium]|nr:hypothetical protein [Candidatus Berkelbacteria bacterium]
MKGIERIMQDDPIRKSQHDLVLTPGEFCFVQDKTKGHVVVYVGPAKQSLSAQSDQPVTFNAKSQRFEPVDLERAIQQFINTPEGHYVVLQNPAQSGDLHQPAEAGANHLPKLAYGRTVVIQGPARFPLWPGQVAEVIEGHRLQTDEFLLVEVYNEKEANERWKAESVMKPSSPVEASGASSKSDDEPERAKAEETPVTLEVGLLTMGQRLVIRGDEVSFYMPPTGIRVVRDEKSHQFVRKAVTLQRLQYCILVGQDGVKRYERGPQVVFPEPDEAFHDVGGERVFEALELNNLTGLHVKVITAYTEEDGKEHKEGEELFITGEQQTIYFPRPEHAFMHSGEGSYDPNDDPRISAVAIPPGQSRYVMERETGVVQTIEGPAMYLPDPRTHVFVRRVLSERQCQLWYPGNEEALRYNTMLRDRQRSGRVQAFVEEAEVERYERETMRSDREEPTRGGRGGAFGSERFERSRHYQPPKTLTFDERFEGAPVIDVWQGFAVQVISQSAGRKVIIGPTMFRLGFDETLEAMSLSKGTPKSPDTRVKTVYLRTTSNRVSDRVMVETRDLCKVQIQLAYHVNFEGDATRWWTLDNYVQFLVDRLRSRLQAVARQKGVEEFYNQATTIIRDSILGTHNDEKAGRAGWSFEENGMRVFDLDVLDIQITDREIASQLTSAQHEKVRRELELAALARDLDGTRQQEEITQAKLGAQAQTHRVRCELESERLDLSHKAKVQQIQASNGEFALELNLQQEAQDVKDELSKRELARERAKMELRVEEQGKLMDLELLLSRGKAEAMALQAQAVTPGLVEALTAVGRSELALESIKSMAPMAMLGGTSVANVLNNILTDTPIGAVAAHLLSGKGNGQRPTEPARLGAGD